MKLIMENWRKFRRECNTCNTLSEASYPRSAESLESGFPEEKIIKDSFKLIDKYAPQFVKDSPYLNGIRFSKRDSNTPDKNSDGHMKGIYGKFALDLIRPTLNFIEVAYKGENPRVYLKNITKHFAKVGDEKLNDEFLDSAPFKSSDKLIFINLNLFRRDWAEDRRYGTPNDDAYNYWLTRLAGTIVHEVAHAEDKNDRKFRKFIYSKIIDKFNDALNDGLFDRELYDDVGNSEKKAEAMGIFIGYLEQDLDSFLPAMSRAAEFHAYNTEIEFYFAMYEANKLRPEAFEAMKDAEKSFRKAIANETT